MVDQNTIRTTILAGVIGDYLGVSCEFVSRYELFNKTLKQIIEGYDTHGVDLGVWSDDTSLTLCTLASLAEQGYNPVDIADRFTKWFTEGYMTATGEVFDIGGTTLWAIKKLISGDMYHMSGLDDKYSNGNGGLMRIMPVILYSLNSSDLVARVSEITAITHRHYISIWSSVYFALYVRNSVKSEDKMFTLKTTSDEFIGLLQPLKEKDRLLSIFANLLEPFPFIGLDPLSLDTTGYVYGTVESVVWLDYFYRELPFNQFVEQALRLGGDTDTVGSIACQLWGLHHSINEIPERWLNLMKKRELIEHTLDRFVVRLQKEGKLFSP